MDRPLDGPDRDAGAREAGPVAAHDLRHLAVALRPLAAGGERDVAGGEREHDLAAVAHAVRLRGAQALGHVAEVVAPGGGALGVVGRDPARLHGEQQVAQHQATEPALVLEIRGHVELGVLRVQALQGLDGVVAGDVGDVGEHERGIEAERGKRALLVAVAADEQRQRGLGAVRERGADAARQHDVTGDRHGRERRHLDVGADRMRHVLLLERGGRHRHQLRQRRVLAEAEAAVGDVEAERHRLAARVLGQRVRALRDAPVEQPAGERRREQREHAHRPRRLAGDRDVAGVAAERRDVALDPVQRRDLVEQAEVDRAAGVLALERRVREEAEVAEAIVDRDHHEALARERRAVVHRRRAVADAEAAAVDPHQDRRVRPGTGRGPDVEVEAVLAGVADRLRAVERREHRLRARRPGAVGGAHAGPRRRRLRRPPAQGIDRRRRIGHALERRDAVAGDAFQAALVGLDDHAHLLLQRVNRSPRSDRWSSPAPYDRRTARRSVCTVTRSAQSFCVSGRARRW